MALGEIMNLKVLVIICLKMGIFIAANGKMAKS